MEQLETLLLPRSDPGRPWSSGEIGARLRTLPESIDLRLRDLREHGLVEPDGEGWRIAAVDARLVAELAGCWKVRRVAVIALIFLIIVAIVDKNRPRGQASSAARSERT